MILQRRSLFLLWRLELRSLFQLKEREWGDLKICWFCQLNKQFWRKNPWLGGLQKSVLGKAKGEWIFLISLITSREKVAKRASKFQIELLEWIGSFTNLGWEGWAEVCCIRLERREGRYPGIIPDQGDRVSMNAITRTFKNKVPRRLNIAPKPRAIIKREIILKKHFLSQILKSQGVWFCGYILWIEEFSEFHFWPGR